jgi:hypothetical protein
MRSTAYLDSIHLPGLQVHDSLNRIQLNLWINVNMRDLARPELRHKNQRG